MRESSLNILTQTVQGSDRVAVPAVRSVEEVYRAHRGAVMGFARRLGGRHLDVDDVVQDVFLRVQKDLAHFRGDAQLTTWLFRITRNVVGLHQRRAKVRQWLRGSQI